ncbi:uncharacterized protein H6S33_002957 [Morchella sextelata]|uniref:uncharacterized protein n=1 Tax=Morchella sextelata TaxID=1174677 RepID=UPI001D04D28A|nr:uncharacterized protein H6S33_002957 [Morchella sextelata]KAH0606969.1 hypothetical protein H6S33_002957 [Morchella sextelata]
MASSSPLYLGFDLSTQQLKVLACSSDLEPQHEEIITFDTDLAHYNVTKGVHTNDDQHQVYAPVAMWIEALDLILTRMQAKGFDFSRVKGVSGAGQQHGSVYWSAEAETILAKLDAKQRLVEQLSPAAFSHPWSPNWQDHSTQAECDTFEESIGGADALARLTGSKAHHRFTGPQILRFHRRFPKVYEKTARISLVSSFLCSLFLGRIAPFDISDVCGMNLWDIQGGKWDETLLSTTAEGEPGGVDGLKARLGPVETKHGKHLGPVSPWFVERFGFSPDCTITPFTGDNPSTILALPLRPLDVIVSLGTSTTLLMSTPTYVSSPSYHMFNHPTTKGLYMFMLCYCNGALARESVRDALNKLHPPHAAADPWSSFNSTALATPPLGKSAPTDPAKLGIYFPIPEIVPNVKAGTWRFEYSDGKLAEGGGWSAGDDARAILESQALSMRMRARPLLRPDAKVNGGRQQPHRVYVVGGASRNQAIAEVVGEVLGGVEGVYRLDVGSNACALGAAYYATWALERAEGEGFEEFVGARWKEEGKVNKVAEGYTEGVWEAYGEVLDGFEEAERRIGAK